MNDDVSSGRDHGGLDEPGQSEADEDVEHVAADGIRHGHVAVASSEQLKRLQGSLTQSVVTDSFADCSETTQCITQR